MSIQRISTVAAPAPSGAYRQAVAHGDVVYLAGQLPLDADGALVGADVAEQTRQTLANIETILQAAGSSLDRVMRATVYLVDGDDWAAMDAVFGAAFGDALPARTAIQVGPLALGARVEIDVIAARG